LENVQILFTFDVIILGCNNGGGGGNFSKVRQFVAMQIGNGYSLFFENKQRQFFGTMVGF